MRDDFASRQGVSQPAEAASGDGGMVGVDHLVPSELVFILFVFVSRDCLLLSF